MRIVIFPIMCHLPRGDKKNSLLKGLYWRGDCLRCIVVDDLLGKIETGNWLINHLHLDSYVVGHR